MKIKRQHAGRYEFNTKNNYVGDIQHYTGTDYKGYPIHNKWMVTVNNDCSDFQDTYKQAKEIAQEFYEKY